MQWLVYIVGTNVIGRFGEAKKERPNPDKEPGVGAEAY
jgi:hypothetical protein